MHHGHVDVKVMGLLKALPTLVAGKLQLRLGFVFGHVVLERRALPALEPADFTPARQGRGSAPSTSCLAQGQTPPTWGCADQKLGLHEMTTTASGAGS